MGICQSTSNEIAYQAFENDKSKVSLLVYELLKEPVDEKTKADPKNLYYSGGGKEGGNKSAVGWACYYGADDTLKKLLTIPWVDPLTWVDSTNGAAPLNDAIQYFNWYLSGREETHSNNSSARDAVDCVKILLAWKPELNEKAVNRINPRTGLTVLMEISQIVGFQEQAHALAIELLANGADPSVFSKTHQTTALHEACKSGNHLIVGEILSTMKNPDEVINIGDRNKETPLALAAKYGNPQCFSLLLGAPGIKVNTVNANQPVVNVNTSFLGTPLLYCILNYRTRVIKNSYDYSKNKQVDMRSMLKALLLSSNDVPQLKIQLTSENNNTANKDRDIPVEEFIKNIIMNSEEYNNFNKQMLEASKKDGSVKFLTALSIEQFEKSISQDDANEMLKMVEEAKKKQNGNNSQESSTEEAVVL